MIQLIWILGDYLIFFSRLIISFIYFNLSYKIYPLDKIKSALIFILATSLALGLFTSISAIILLFFEMANFTRSIVKKQVQLEKLPLIAYFIILISSGPGWSLDKILDIRLTN